MRNINGGNYMNTKNFFKVVAKIAAVSGVAFVVYKLGECNGESRARIHQKYDDCEDDYYSLPDYDEPDCGCIKPSSNIGEKSCVAL